MKSWLAGILASVVIGGSLAAQAPPREFPEFRGTWLLDEGATSQSIGAPTARVLVIATAPTHVTLTKDASVPETYRFDGTESQVEDDGRTSFTLIADRLALTTKRSPRGRTNTNIITDAYAVAGDVLTIERQRSVLWPPGTLATLTDPLNGRQTLIYRRAPQAAAPSGLTRSDARPRLRYVCPRARSLLKVPHVI